jgi:hypothetical protein
MDLRDKCGLASPPGRAARISAWGLALCAVLSLNTLAFNSSLQPEEVRDAYSLGQSSNHEELADFYSQYVHKFRYPANNPVVYVMSAEFQTPYEQIVSRSQQTIHYSKFQADEDYRANPRLVIVKVEFSLRLNYAGPEPPADGYKVFVSQARSIEPRKIANTVTCDPYYSGNYALNTSCQTYAREILLQFDAGQFGPGAANIKIQTPDGQTVQTKFNLDKLK